MPVYHKWKTIFVHIPKNASSSIHSRLKNNTDDIHSHITFLEILSDNDAELIESYYSFAVTRNPYDRFVSAFEQEDSHDRTNNISFEDFVKHINNIDDLSIYFKPQYKFITIKSLILVDDIIKFENLNDEWLKISKKINSNSLFNLKKTLDVINANPIKINKSWKDYYTEETKEIVYNLYKKDFELFKYDK